MSRHVLANYDISAAVKKSSLILIIIAKVLQSVTSAPPEQVILNHARGEHTTQSNNSIAFPHVSNATKIYTVGVKDYFDLSTVSGPPSDDWQTIPFQKPCRGRINTFIQFRIIKISMFVVFNLFYK